jgi:hypothetical protein
MYSPDNVGIVSDVKTEVNTSKGYWEKTNGGFFVLQKKATLKETDPRRKGGRDGSRDI